jgi:hypothetical protein
MEDRTVQNVGKEDRQGEEKGAAAEKAASVDMWRDTWGRIWVPNGHPTSTGWVMLDDVDWQEVGGVIYVRD